MKRGAPLKRTAFRRRPGWTPPATSSARSLHPANGLRKPTRHVIPAKIRTIVKDRSQGLCEAPEHAPSCSGHAEHIHHRRLLSQQGTDHPGNLMALSSQCHRHWHDVERHRAEELGIIVRSVHVIESEAS